LEHPAPNIEPGDVWCHVVDAIRGLRGPPADPAAAGVTSRSSTCRDSPRLAVAWQRATNGFRLRVDGSGCLVVAVVWITLVLGPEPPPSTRCRKGRRTRPHIDTPVTNFKPSNTLYRQNSHLDRDKDGVACEKA